MTWLLAQGGAVAEIAARKSYVRPESRRPKLTMPWMPKLLTTVGPVALAVLAYSGQLGASPILGWVPVDVTAATAAVVALSFVASFLTGGKLSPWIGVPAVLWVLLLIPIAMYVPTAYADDKTTSLLMLLPLCLIAPFQVLRYKIQRQVFLGTLAVCAVLSGALILDGGEQAAIAAQLSSEVMILEGANTISTARIVGTGAIVLIMVALTMGGGRRWLRLGFLATGLALIVVMAATGSRGPLAAIVAAIAVLILVAPIMRGRRFRSLLVIGVGAIGALYWAGSRSIVESNRAFSWLAGERDSSTSTREYIWDISMDYVSRHPMGTGWGGFSTIPDAPITIAYPHNLFLELVLEAGWFIGALAVLFVLASLWLMMRRSTEPVAAALFALAVFAFINAMVSGDLNDNRLLWMLLATAWVPVSSPDPVPQERPAGRLPTSASWQRPRLLP